MIKLCFRVYSYGQKYMYTDVLIRTMCVIWGMLERLLELTLLLDYSYSYVRS